MFVTCNSATTLASNLLNFLVPELCVDIFEPPPSLPPTIPMAPALNTCAIRQNQLTILILTEAQRVVLSYSVTNDCAQKLDAGRLGLYYCLIML